MDATALFENTMDSMSLRGFHDFAKEADIVRDAKTRMERKVKDDGLPYRVAKERPLIGGIADLIMSGSDGSVLVAIELKYEPHRSRLPSTQARVIWSEVETDIRKVQGYVGTGGVGAAYAILVDADGRWRSSHPNAPEGSEWRDWGNGVSALWTKVGGDSSA